MDDIIEAVLEIIITPLWDLLFQSRKVKNWIKTGIYLLFTQGITLFIAFVGLLSSYISQTGRWVIAGIAAVWCLITVIFGIYEHKRKWTHY